MGKVRGATLGSTQYRFSSCRVGQHAKGYMLFSNRCANMHACTHAHTREMHPNQLQVPRPLCRVPVSIMTQPHNCTRLSALDSQI